MLVLLLVLCTSHSGCVKVKAIAPCIPLCHPPLYESVQRCCLITYCTVSETPSSPSPPIGPVPTSAQPQEEGASSTGKEPPSVYWMALVLYMRVCVCVCVCVCMCLCLHVYVFGGLYINIVPGGDC